MNKIAFSVPTYNEENNISIFLDSILNNFDHSKIIICVVDDQSRDETVKIIKKYKEKYDFINIIERIKQSNRTQVYSAYHAGLNFFKDYEDVGVYCQIDSDNMVDIKSIKKSIKILLENKNIDVVKLSKYHNGSQIDRKFIRKFYSYVYSFICKIFYKSDIKDFSTGIRFYNFKAYKFLTNKEKKFASPIGLLDDLLLLIDNKFKIMEVPFILTDREYGQSFISIKESFLCLIELFKCIILNKYIRR